MLSVLIHQINTTWRNFDCLALYNFFQNGKDLRIMYPGVNDIFQFFIYRE